ncbi:hypothetical protein ACA910_019014 [Epithemia clementina (nom. ined.)]
MEAASSSSADVALPKSLTDFIFDLYDSVITAQLMDEQVPLYETTFRDLSSKYFTHQAWPLPQSVAAECNGDPLFLALYREMTHRHWHQVVLTRPTLRDRMEGFHVYRELFDEILEVVADSGEEDANFFLLPAWVFDIFHEFGYQFQGYCQVRSAVYASARKHGLVTVDPQQPGKYTLSGTAAAAVAAASTNNNNASSVSGGNATGGTNTNTTTNTPSSNLLENLILLENNLEAWDVEIVFQYLHRFAELGFSTTTTSKKVPPVYQYLSMFALITKSRLDCLLGDFTGCIQALTPLSVHGSTVISSNGMTVTETIQSVTAAHISLAYHVGVSLLLLRRYKDARQVLNDICATLLRTLKNTPQQQQQQQQQQRHNKQQQQHAQQNSQQAQNEQYYKQLERMLSLLALIQIVLFGSNGNTNNNTSNSKSTSTNNNESMDDAVWRALKDKHGTRLDAVGASAAASVHNTLNTPSSALAYEEWFASPKFVTTDPTVSSFHRQQIVQAFLVRELEPTATHRALRSYLQLYTTLPVTKLSLFYYYDTSSSNKTDKTKDMIPLLLSYKLRHYQLERTVSTTTTTTTSTLSGAATAAMTASAPSSSLFQSYDPVVDSAAVQWNDALPAHFYMIRNVLYMDEDATEKKKTQQRLWYEKYFITRLEQNVQLLQNVAQNPKAIDPSDFL